MTAQTAMWMCRPDPTFQPCRTAFNCKHLDLWWDKYFDLGKWSLPWGISRWLISAFICAAQFAFMESGFQAALQTSEWALCLKLGKLPSCPCQVYFQLPIVGSVTYLASLSFFPHQVSRWANADGSIRGSVTLHWLPGVNWVSAGCLGCRDAQPTLSYIASAKILSFSKAEMIVNNF